MKKPQRIEKNNIFIGNAESFDKVNRNRLWEILSKKRNTFTFNKER